MADLVLLQLQQAIYSKLTADGVLMGMVQGLYDIVPEKTAFPYLVFGAARQFPADIEHAEWSRSELTLEVYSAAKRHSETLTILNRVHGLLELQPLVLTQATLHELRVSHVEIEQIENPILVRGLMHLEAITSKSGAI